MKPNLRTDDSSVVFSGGGVWDTARIHDLWMQQGVVANRRATERRLAKLGIWPRELAADDLVDEAGRPPVRKVLNSEIEQARSHRNLVLFAQLHSDVAGHGYIHLNDARGGRRWVALDPTLAPERALTRAWTSLRDELGQGALLIPHAELAGWARTPDLLPGCSLLAFAPMLDWREQRFPDALEPRRQPSLPQLQNLEDESIFILREAVAEAERPVMLYSAGKDSGVLLHLARKAFYPGAIPFPLLHVDTRWKFQEMIRFRDFMAKRYGVQLITHINPEAVAKDINPFDHGSALHTHITKTEGLKQVLQQHGFDMVFGGARRDEERSRAKERVFSLRNAAQAWDPKNQRPEPWSLYNTRKPPGYSFRVFPLSNWTELDVWLYTRQESIPVVPLYFARTRPVVVHEDMLMLVDDDRCRLAEGDKVQARKVRFRTLGCYPLTGAVESDAADFDAIIDELSRTRHSERQGRKIDFDSSGSMEKKKQEGYF